MQIKVFGVKLIPCEKISMSKVWQEVERYSTSQIKALAKYLIEDADDLPPILSDKQIIVCQNYENDYKAGIVLKIKDVKALFSVNAKSGNVKVNARDLEEGERQIEINFFLIRKDSGKGLYAYYHQSSHMNDFCRLVKQAHERLLGPEREKLQASRELGDINEKQLSAFRSELNSLTYEIMVKNGDASKLIEELTSIKKIRLVFTDWEKQSKDQMTPLVSQAKRTVVEMSFDKDSTNLSSLKNTLSTIIGRGDISKLRVEGCDPDDMDQIINLEKNLDDFGRDDYQNFAKTTREVDLSDLQNSWNTSAALKWLKKISERPNVARRLKP